MIKTRWPILILFLFTLSLKSYAEDDAIAEESQAASSDHSVFEQENADEFKGMDGGTFTGEAGPEEEAPSPAAEQATQRDAEKAEKADLEPTEDKGSEFKSVHKIEMKEDEQKPAKAALSKEERQKMFDKTDSDCFAFDNAGKYKNSVTMMKNCTKAFKKVKNREGLKWTMIYFDRNQDDIEDAKCMKRGPAQRSAAKKGIQNKCQILFMDSSELCKNGKFKRNRWISAQFIDLCAHKGLALYPLKVKAGSLTCRFNFSDENKDSTPVGAFLSQGKGKKGNDKGRELIAFGMNESNYMADRLPALNEKKIMDKLKKEQTLIVNAGPAKYFDDPSLCMNGRPAAPKSFKAKPVEMRAPASKGKAKLKPKKK